MKSRIPWQNADLLNAIADGIYSYLCNLYVNKLIIAHLVNKLSVF
jgi:hypothetical protein